MEQLHWNSLHQSNFNTGTAVVSVHRQKSVMESVTEHALPT